jgi:hypothetical protein
VQRATIFTGKVHVFRPLFKNILDKSGQISVNGDTFENLEINENDLLFFISAKIVD